MDWETFEKIKNKAIETTASKLFNGSITYIEKVAMHQLLEELLNEIMKCERNIFLEGSANNKGSGEA